MKYGKKIFKIEGKSDTPRDFIKFNLSWNVHFGEGQCSSYILCDKSYPFNTWKTGDCLEIDLDKIRCSGIRKGDIINDAGAIRILDEKVVEEIRKSQIELYELKKTKESLIPMLNNFSQKITNENFVDFNIAFEFDDEVDKFAFDEFAVPVWKKRLGGMANKFDELKRKNEDLQRGKNDLERENDDWEIKFNNKDRENEDNKEKYERVQTELNRLQNERLGETRGDSDEKIRLERIISDTRSENARLQERLESYNSQNIELRNQNQEKENQIGRLELKVDEKSVRIQDLTGQLTNLQIEKNNKENELHQKDEEIQRLKKWAGLSREELLREKVHLKEGKIGNLSNQLGINLNQVGNLRRYYERLVHARKNHNQANIETHEDNITRIKETFRQGGISIDDIQRLGRKCEKIAELRFELSQIQQEQYQTHQEQPTNH
jgi:hypothetical protein